MKLRILVALIATFAHVVDCSPPGVTDYQKQLLESTMTPAIAASKAAESKLLGVFSSTRFTDHLKGLGTPKAAELASTAPGDILAELKENFEFVEYTTNFKLDILLSDWQDHGWYLSSWQYCVLVGHGCPQELYDISETSLYKLKPFAQKGHPTSMEEANERGRYVFKSMHLLDIGGDWNFGSTVLIYRQSVIRNRAIQVGGDSGQFVDACVLHTSPPPSGYDCNFMNNMVQGRLGADLHEFYGQAVAYHQVRQRTLEGEIAQNIWNLLDPDATINTVADDPEIIIMGSVTPDDVKVISASFGATFGTTDGDNLVAACQKYKIPLVWHFGDGSTQSKEPWNWKPDQPFHCGRPRLLDPATVDATSSGGDISKDQRAIWTKVEQEARSYRAGGAQPSDDQIKAWFDAASASQTSVMPLRTGNKCDADLCFGVRRSTGQCACRMKPSADVLV